MNTSFKKYQWEYHLVQRKFKTTSAASQLTKIPTKMKMKSNRIFSQAIKICRLVWISRSNKMEISFYKKWKMKFNLNSWMKIYHHQLNFLKLSSRYSNLLVSILTTSVNPISNSSLNSRTKLRSKIGIIPALILKRSQI